MTTRQGRGSRSTVRLALTVLATVQSTAWLALTDCSGSVNALALDPTSDAALADGPPELGGPAACPVNSAGPAGVAPLPTPLQVAYQRTELTAFVHLGLETFDGSEQGDPSKDAPSLFNPTSLDATQWVSAFKNAGFREVMLNAKHGTGFCLWPSAYTDYSVRSSPWKNGQGDVVREFVDAMNAAGMKVGLYLSPRDQHYPSSSAGYEAYLRNLLTELLTGYGPVDEILFEGDNAPKSIDWSGIAQLAKTLQPDVLVWMGPEIATTGVDLRWIGSTSGPSTRSTSSVANVPNGGPTGAWYPPDVHISVRSPNWFWHPSDAVIPLKALQTSYFDTVGMNATLRLNVPPATTGQFDAPDVTLLQDFGTWYSSLFKLNLAQGQAATTDSTWATSGFGAAQAMDGDICTYWAAATGKTTGRIEVTPTAPVTFSLISIREPMELGERTTAYHVEIRQHGAWNKTPTDASGARIQGTVIGQRQLWRLEPTTADAVALVIDDAKDTPAIAEFGLY
jgi:alpha-L-fucosidase